MTIEEMRDEVDRLAVCKYYRALTEKTENEWFRIFENKTAEQLRDAISTYISRHDEFPAPSEILKLIERKERPKPEAMKDFQCPKCHGAGRILIEFPHGSIAFGCDCQIGKFKYPADKRGFAGLKDPEDVLYYFGEDLRTDEIEYRPVKGKPVWIAVNKREEARKEAEARLIRLEELMAKEAKA